MNIFNSEDDLQVWLEKLLGKMEGLSAIINNIPEIKNFEPNSISERKIKESFLTCLESLHLNEILTENKNISSVRGDILKPDIIAYAPETESIVIIELKNHHNATRQAGTELSAYASEIKSGLSYLSDGDLVHVIISNSWPTLLKHYIYNNIFWQGKNTICLEPCMNDDVIGLEIVDISLLVQADIPMKISEEQLGGYHICLYDDSQQTRSPQQTKLHQRVKLMKSSVSCMATRGERMNTHGFAFLSRETDGYGMSPYFITLVNVAPFKSIEKVFHTEENLAYSDLTLIQQKLLDVYLEYAPEGHGYSLNSLFDTASKLLETICTPRPESYSSWEYLKTHITDNCKPIYFDSWGIFKEIATMKLSEKYNEEIYHIDLNSVSLGYEVLDELIDKNYPYINLQHLPDEFFPVDHPRRKNDDWSLDFEGDECSDL
jgi:hypothetical protein